MAKKQKKKKREELEKAGKTKIEIVADPPSAFLSTVRKIEESG